MKGKVAPTKSTTKAYVSFCFSLSAVVSPALYLFFLSTVKQTKLLHSISEMFFTFLARKTLSKTFLVECVRSGAANCNKRRGILARNSHTSVAFDWTYHFSHLGKNIVRDSDWTYHFFFTCENHRSLLWLARTNLRTKIYDIAFWWVFLSMYIINLLIYSWTHKWN